MQVNKAHRYCHTPHGFQMSPYLQEIVVFSGQNHVFEDASEQLAKLLGVEVTAKQVERLTHAYGELIETAQQDQACALGQEDALGQKDALGQEDALHYCMVDGGMVLTREDDWKEIKLARVFEAKAHMAESEKRNLIRASSYTAHLGGHTPFFKKLEKQTDPLKNMVWVCDGAKWIWNWVESSYPESTRILDYFHCTEKLHAFARESFKGKPNGEEWVSQQEKLLLNGQADLVIAGISSMPCRGKAKQMQRSLLTYYENNLKRMDYKKYREQGLLIGSGPMEAAHRHVIQTRMKLSGQRWTLKGAQQVANLRVANKSGNWQQVIKYINLN
jgi:uncharacterized protein YaeQ